jgi:hypothetical protein
MTTFIKPLLAAMFGVVALASPATVFAEPVGPAPKTTGIMGIVEMKVDESGKIISPLTNSSAKPLSVSYVWTKWNGSSWEFIKTGSIAIPAKDRVVIAIRVPRTNAEQRVRLEISAFGHISVARELKMRAKKVYVLQYKTRDWVQIDYQYQRTTSELIGQGVNDKIAEAKALGFATKRKTDTTTYVVGANAYRTYAYAKMDDWKEKTFETKEERDAFHRKILKVVPPYTNDGPGLNTKLIER